MDQSNVTIEYLPRIADIDAPLWDACACPEAAEGGAPYDPFTTHRFLLALEASGSTGKGTGWEPHHMVARLEGEVIAVAPLYAKGHSQGEYIFDHNWANAYERAGGRYYPKLQMAVPVTPVAGRRFLTRPEHAAPALAALVEGAVQLAADNMLSSLHITFCTEAEALAGATLGLLPRTSQQFHWTNPGYGDFDAFLATLSSRKRKAIRKERLTAQDFGGDIVRLTGAKLRPEHWSAFWAFYQDTGARKWGHPYLTRDFFDRIHQTMADDILLILALKDGRPIAGALNFLGRDALFGRYWGAIEDHPCLHFELCYYQAIDHAIERGLARVEAGAQGEHKLARGYLPVTCHSLHWFHDPGFREAIARYLQAERDAVGEEIDMLTAYSPFKRGNPEELP